MKRHVFRLRRWHARRRLARMDLQSRLLALGLDQGKWR